jgi:MFS superfamily sulfate permease-like transporter
MLASLSLVDLATLRTLWKIDRVEVIISIFVTLGVVAFGAIDAILVAVAMAVIRYVRFVSRPKAEVLGKVNGLPGFHGVDRHPEAETTPGLVLFRFNGPVVFFNAPHFKRTLLKAVDAAGPEVRWVVIDMLPIPLVDATGHFVVQEVVRALETRGTKLVTAGRMTEWQEWGRKHGFTEADDHSVFFPDLASATEAFTAGAAPKRSA